MAPQELPELESKNTAKNKIHIKRELQNKGSKQAHSKRLQKRAKSLQALQSTLRISTVQDG